MVDFFDDRARPNLNKEACHQNTRASSIIEGSSYIIEGCGLSQIKLEHLAEGARQAYFSMLEPAETLLGMLAQIDEPSGGDPISLCPTNGWSKEDHEFFNTAWSLAGHILAAYSRATELWGDYLRLADEPRAPEVYPVSSELSVAADSVRAAIEVHRFLSESFAHQQILFDESNPTAADTFWEMGKTSFSLLKNTLEAFARVCRADDEKDTENS